jgi:hypothetical protein
MKITKFSIGPAALGLLAAGLLSGGIASRPKMVDLRPQQTPLRLQTRSNCFIHATVAAMEAAYKRAGYGDLDLSELFSDTVGEVLFLEYCQMNGRYYTRTMRVPGARERETPLALDHAMTIESASPCMIFGIPEERYAPFPPLVGLPSPGLNDPLWSNQYNVSAYNLDLQRLPLSALIAPLYYRIASIQWLPAASAKDPEALEEVLAQGHEVIWDFKQTGEVTDDVWQYTQPADPMGPGHRLLLVGYNRTDSRNPYFIAKNSWGPTRTPGAQGYTYISYGYMQYGEWAHYITKVDPPRPWPAFKFIGRWSFESAELRGTLDIYHLPGMMEKVFKDNAFLDETGRIIQDRRLGTFYRNGDREQAYRVNGNIFDNGIELYIDFDNPAPRWDICRGWRFSFKTNPANPVLLEGDGLAPDGRSFYAAARRVKVSGQK